MSAQVTYICDNCGAKTVKGIGPLPQGWVHLENMPHPAMFSEYPTSPENRHFCGWTCMSLWAISVLAMRQAILTALEQSGAIGGKK